MNLQSFLYFQPNYPVETATDKYYLEVASVIEKKWRDSGLLEVHPVVAMLTSINMIGYFQDVVYDAGLWRTFTGFCKKAYGHYLPFENTDDETYIPNELNGQDVRFLLWYFIAFTSPDHHLISPDDEQLIKLSRLIYEILESKYNDAPKPDNFEYFFKIDLEENPPAEQVYDFTQWLYWRSWLLTPVFMYYNNNVALELEKLDKEHTPEAKEKAEKLRTDIMTRIPTGPLALNIGEWVRMLLTNDIVAPVAEEEDKDKPEHPYYAGFMRVSGGHPLMFLPTYEGLNNFVIDALGWEKGVNHLEQLKDANNFVLKIDRVKGMLIAPYISPCIASDRNPTYDSKFATANAIELLTVKGACPPDLRKYLLENDMLPNAVFPGSDNHRLVVDNADFIGRCYLQDYYSE